MKIEKVTFQTTYNIGPYLNVKVGFEASPEPYHGHDFDRPPPMETPQEVLTTLRKIADEWHKKEYPHLYQEPSAHFHGLGPIPENQRPEPIPIISIDNERIEIAIDNATTLEELTSVKVAAWRAGLVSQYMQKLNKLMNNGTN